MEFGVISKFGKKYWRFLRPKIWQIPVWSELKNTQDFLAGSNEANQLQKKKVQNS